MRRSIQLLQVLFAGLLFANSPVFANATPLTPDDEQFVDKLAQANLAEIKLGGLAEKNAMSPSVKKFGREMVKDHTILNDQLKEWATRQKINLPTSISAEDQRTGDKFSNLSGNDFDRQYIQLMLKDHQKDVDQMRKFAETSSNPEVKKLATQNLPFLENHLRVAENVAGRIGLSAKGGLDRPEHPS